MKKTLLLLALILSMTACGNPDTQFGKPVAKDDTDKLCAALQNGNRAIKCAVQNRGSTVDLTLDTHDEDEVVRRSCEVLAGNMKQYVANFSGQWQLQIFSPYRDDKPIASCALH